MATYQITSRSGITSTYSASSAAAALLAQHRDAGYCESVVWLEGGELAFRSPEDRDLLGDLDAWGVVEIEAGPDLAMLVHDALTDATSAEIDTPSEEERRENLDTYRRWLDSGASIEVPLHLRGYLEGEGIDLGSDAAAEATGIYYRKLIEKIEESL